uniref:Uncharacterized protein LOC105034026 isoform X2 n=1 Tax=Elaeis guineensis var. tenera TaxID=51953 RepID=A0A8N4F0Y4_ELAGV|nr:uncharacterized protein LOC105034026 isoform X2 [Elaeis guineensis]
MGRNKEKISLPLSRRRRTKQNMKKFTAAATLPPPRTIFPMMMGILFFSSSTLALAKPSSRAISDSEISDRKNACYADIDSGLRGERCRSSMIAKENCALKCVSPLCYELIYESDPFVREFLA